MTVVLSALTVGQFPFALFFSDGREWKSFPSFLHVVSVFSCCLALICEGCEKKLKVEIEDGKMRVFVGKVKKLFREGEIDGKLFGYFEYFIRF